MPKVARAVVAALGELVGAAAVLLVIGLAVGFFVIGRHGGGPIQAMDNTVGHWFLGHRGPLVGVSKLIATYLDAAPLAIIAIVVSAAMFLRIRSFVAAIPLVAYLGGEFQVFAIREVIHRPRPLSANFPDIGAIAGVHETSYSFPSGHAVAVTAVLFALACLVATTRHAVWPYVLAMPVALFVTDTRLVLGVHWLSDVVFGLIAGIAWGVIVTRVLCRFESSIRRLRTR